MDRLKELESRCLLERKAINGLPIAITYELTEIGLSALQTLDDLCSWSETNNIE